MYTHIIKYGWVEIDEKYYTYIEALDVDHIVYFINGRKATRKRYMAFLSQNV